MTVDITAAGNRSLETLSSLSDVQNAIRSFRNVPNISMMGNEMQEVVRSLRMVTDFLTSNPSLEANGLNQPVTHPGFSTFDYLNGSRSIISDPIGLADFQPSHSKIFASSQMIIPCFPPFSRANFNQFL